MDKGRRSNQLIEARSLQIKHAFIMSIQYNTYNLFPIGNYAKAGHIFTTIVIGKEPSHSEYYSCTVVTAVCTYEIQMQHVSPHFLIQYSYNTGRFEVSNTCMYSSHGDKTKNTSRLDFAMKYCYINFVEYKSRILITYIKYVAQPMSIS